MSMVLEIWKFLRARKKLWLGPVVIIMAMLALLLVLAQSSAIAPFIYTLF